MSKTIIDGDIIAYRCSFAHKSEDLSVACKGADELMEYILAECSFYNPSGVYQVYLTGSGNYREDIAKTHVYKGHRKSVEKPRHLTGLRDYLIMAYGAIVSHGEEADDMIAKDATAVGPKAVVASADKDMLQIPAYHFNFNRGEWKVVTKDTGLKFFYTQILTGDDADNIKGLFRVGPKKAEAILKGATTEEELWGKVVEAYEGDTDRVVENARLLWLRRYEDELWHPPHQRKPREEKVNKR